MLNVCEITKSEMVFSSTEITTVIFINLGERKLDAVEQHDRQ